jgi:hypothetical protein
MDALFTVTVGEDKTVTVTVSKVEQPLFSPVTVYTVSDVGETEMLDVVCPVLQV